jgi:small subunit ribosomal protein S20
MPVTKTAKRALRGSTQKQRINTAIISHLEIAIRLAKKDKSGESVKKAISLTDRASKKNVIHKNKAARIKSTLSKISSTKAAAPAKKSSTKKAK